MKLGTRLRACVVALALGLAGCSSGSDIASPGGTDPGSSPGGGGPGGNPGGGPGNASCPTGTTNRGALGTNTICELAGQILTNFTLPKITDVVYRIAGRVDVGADVGGDGNLQGGQSATLTVAPGVTLFGDEAGDVLIVNRGSRIVAEGSVSQPITFTSREDVAAGPNPGQSRPDANTANREWGGVILLGRAPIRGCNTAVTQGSVDCQSAIEGVLNATGRNALYGGATPTDNSGRLRFVRVLYAGAFLSSSTAGDDLNGITLGGVGSGTEIDFVQVHNNGDDGVEVFGGTVNLKHVVLTGELDDSLDYDEGWTGKVQYIVTRQTAFGAGGPDRLIEASNRTVASAGGSLNTNPTIANFTFIGLPQVSPATGQGVVLNNTSGTPGSSGRFINGVVTGANSCLNTDTANSSPAPVLNSILFDCPAAYSATTQATINAGTNVTTNVSATLAGVLPGPNEVNHAAANPASIDSFFDAAIYVGAFSPSDTAGSNWAAGWTVQLFQTLGCPAGTTENGTLAGQRRCLVAGVIGQGSVPANVRLTAGNIYQISGRVDVGVDRGGAGAGGVAASLVIDAGVTLFGNSSADILVVNRGSQIFVNGTRVAPVIMTSLPDVTNTQVDPINAHREWAGLILLGRAPIRGCNAAVAQGSVDCQNAIEGVLGATGSNALYGGATSTDSSGRITYLQIRFPGAFLTSAAAGDDLNGLTLGGVGSGTLIENVQVHNSGDDGIEVFGGLVNMRNLVITGAEDDSLDCDEGWTGLVQFAIIRQRSVSATIPDRLIECSNRTVASLAGTLHTNPTIANFTFVGAPGTGQGVVLNNTSGTPGGSARLINGVATGSNVCLITDTANTSPAPVLNSILFGCTGAYSTASQATIAAGTNVTTNVAPTLLFGFINGSAETAHPAFNPATVNPFFVATNYVGAVRNDSDNWWRTWTCGLESGSAC